MIHTNQCRDVARIEGERACTLECSEFRKGLKQLAVHVRSSWNRLGTGYMLTPETYNELQVTLDELVKT